MGSPSLLAKERRDFTRMRWKFYPWIWKVLVAQGFFQEEQVNLKSEKGFAMKGSGLKK